MKKRTCPSCEIDLLSIHVISNRSKPARRGFMYTVGEIEFGWIGIKNMAGTIQGHLCPECDQVLFFASPEHSVAQRRRGP